jgi:hypothetical protein
MTAQEEPTPTTTCVAGMASVEASSAKRLRWNPLERSERPVPTSRHMRRAVKPALPPVRSGLISDFSPNLSEPRGSSHVAGERPVDWSVEGTWSVA